MEELIKKLKEEAHPETKIDREEFHGTLEELFDYCEGKRDGRIAFARELLRLLKETHE